MDTPKYDSRFTLGNIVSIITIIAAFIGVGTMVGTQTMRINSIDEGLRSITQDVKSDRISSSSISNEVAGVKTQVAVVNANVQSQGADITHIRGVLDNMLRVRPAAFPALFVGSSEPPMQCSDENPVRVSEHCRSLPDK